METETSPAADAQLTFMNSNSNPAPAPAVTVLEIGSVRWCMVAFTQFIALFTFRRFPVSVCDVAVLTSPLANSRLRIRKGVRAGFQAFSRPTAPATCGVAIEVAL